MISVIIPTYNREKTIGKSIESVLNQTYTDFELLIVDDGSKDNTKAIVEQYKDERIRLISYAPNQGAAHARNIGILNAKGNYIAFHDSDDLMRPDRLEKQLMFLESQEADFVFAKVHEYGLDGSDRGASPLSCNLDNDKLQNVKKLLLQWQVWCQTILCTKYCAESIMFDEEFPCGIDWDFSIRVAKKYKIRFQDIEVSDNYRLTSSISANEKNQYKCHFLMREKYKDIIEKDAELKKILFSERF